MLSLLYGNFPVLGNALVVTDISQYIQNVFTHVTSGHFITLNKRMHLYKNAGIVFVSIYGRRFEFLGLVHSIGKMAAVTSCQNLILKPAIPEQSNIGAMEHQNQGTPNRVACEGLSTDNSG